MARRTLVRASSALFLAAPLAAASAQQTSTPNPASESPLAPSAAPLTLDIQSHVDEIVARELAKGLPRFEEAIEVRDRLQEAIEGHLRGVDLECGASESGPPTADETRRYRSTSIPPHADFLALGKVLYKGVQRLIGPRKPRFFLYAVRRGRAERVGYVLRDGPVSDSTRAAVPGASWELVASFRDRAEASAALRRLERGFATPQRAHEDGRLPPWVASTCRPPRWK